MIKSFFNDFSIRGFCNQRKNTVGFRIKETGKYNLKLPFTSILWYNFSYRSITDGISPTYTNFGRLLKCCDIILSIAVLTCLPILSNHSLFSLPTSASRTLDYRFRIPHACRDIVPFVGDDGGTPFRIQIPLSSVLCPLLSDL